jgi:hypothetical protein
MILKILVIKLTHIINFNLILYKVSKRNDYIYSYYNIDKDLS